MGERAIFRDPDMRDGLVYPTPREPTGVARHEVAYAF